MFENLICVNSDSIDVKMLQSCNSIIAAFLPGKTVRFNTKEEIGCFSDFFQIELDPTLTFFTLYYYQKDKLLLSRKYDLLPLTLEQIITLPGKEALHQIQVKRAIYLFLQDLTGKKVPWGILTGVRPGKLVLRMQELGIPMVEQKKILAELYMVD